MSYEDLVAARAARLQKEADKTARTKQGRKRKGRVQPTCVQGTAEETAEGSAQAETQETTNVLLQVAGTQFENGMLAPCPGRAPVARMW